MEKYPCLFYSRQTKVAIDALKFLLSRVPTKALLIYSNQPSPFTTKLTNPHTILHSFYLDLSFIYLFVFFLLHYPLLLFLGWLLSFPLCMPSSATDLCLCHPFACSSSSRIQICDLNDCCVFIEI